MTLAQNYNPYYNDFDPDKNFLQILFRPGVPVQARELTQLQSILQEQISRFAGYLLENGNAITGGGVTVEAVDYYSYKPIYSNASVQIDKHDGLAFTSGTKSGTIVGVNEGQTLIYVRYNSGSTDLFSGNLVTTSAGSFNIETSTGYETGQAYLVKVSPGVFFINDRFVELTEELSFIPVIRGTTFGGYVAIDFVEKIITAKDDVTLYDPAKGTYNFAGPGADRLTYDATLKYYTGTPPATVACIVDFNPAGSTYTIKANSPFLSGPDYTQVSLAFNSTYGAWTLNVSGNTNATIPYSINLSSLPYATYADATSAVDSHFVMVLTDALGNKKSRQVNSEFIVPKTFSAVCSGAAPSIAVGAFWFDTSSIPYILRQRTSTGWTDIPAANLHPSSIVDCSNSTNVYEITNGIWVKRATSTALDKLEGDIAAISPCNAPSATPAQVNLIVADPTDMKVSVCIDGLGVMSINGDDLIRVLNVGQPSAPIRHLSPYYTNTSGGNTVTTTQAGEYFLSITTSDETGATTAKKIIKITLAAGDDFEIIGIDHVIHEVTFNGTVFWRTVNGAAVVNSQPNATASTAIGHVVTTQYYPFPGNHFVQVQNTSSGGFSTITRIELMKFLN